MYVAMLATVLDFDVVPLLYRRLRDRRVGEHPLKAAERLAVQPDAQVQVALPALVAALRGARVTATDWSPEAIEALRENAARNRVEIALWAYETGRLT